MKKVLLQDIVIPAGTIFDSAASKTVRHGEGHFCHGIGLTKDSSGDLVYYVDVKDDPEIAEWFGDMDCFEGGKGGPGVLRKSRKEQQEYKPIKIKPWANTLTQRCSIGNGKYVIANLHKRADELITKEMPMEHLNTYNLKIGEEELKSFTSHMRSVLDADLNYPIILDDEGFVMDGRHRIVKSLFLGKTHIKYVRFETTPDPDYFEDEEEGSNE